jgi:hypothetical protein
VHPSLTFKLGRGWTLAGAALVYWRESLHDGIYDLAGNLLRGDGDTRARYIGAQVELVLTYEHSRTLDFLLAYAEFHPGTFITATGPSRTIQFIAAEARLWF